MPLQRCTAAALAVLALVTAGGLPYVAGQDIGPPPFETDCKCDGRLCPLGQVVPASARKACRPRDAYNPCDVAEYCDGKSAACPPDAFKLDGSTCSACGPDHPVGPDMILGGRRRLSTTVAKLNCACYARMCIDLAEVDGSCDKGQPRGYPCRLATGPCDAVETCNGVNRTCPGDAWVPASAKRQCGCGTCDGRSAACPVSASCMEDLPLTVGGR